MRKPSGVESRTPFLSERWTATDDRGEWMAVGGREGRRREIKGTRTTKGNMRPRIGLVATDSSHRQSHTTSLSTTVHHLSLLSPHHSSIPDSNFPSRFLIQCPFRQPPCATHPAGPVHVAQLVAPFNRGVPSRLLDPIPRVRRQASFPIKSPSFNHHHHTLTYSIPIPTGYPS